MTKTIKDKLEDWQAGKANGYFEPRVNEIHLLNGDDVELRALWHETAHAARQDKLSFKLARALNRPAINNFLVGFLILTALISFVFSIVPFFVAAGIFGLLVFCQAREEIIAEKAVNQKIKSLKRGETQK